LRKASDGAGFPGLGGSQKRKKKEGDDDPGDGKGKGGLPKKLVMEDHMQASVKKHFPGRR